MGTRVHIESHKSYAGYRITHAAYCVYGSLTRVVLSFIYSQLIIPIYIVVVIKEVIYNYVA